MTHYVPALIVGGGISGLVCAYALRKAGMDAVLVEASDRPGGSIHSLPLDGYLLELGPQSFSSTPPLLALFAELGIEADLVQAPAHAPRYILVDGVLKQVPLSPPAFLTSDLVSARTKWAVARDLFGKSRVPDQDESVAAFVRRKFSAELLDRLVGPFVSGVYAGDPERLSLRSAFPMVHDAEKRKGSVIRGMMAKSGERPRQGPTLQSFRDGTEALARAIAAGLGDRLQLNARVTRVELDAAGTSFQLTIRSPGKEETILADNVIMATPADVTGELLRDVISPTMGSLLSAIEYAPVAVVSLGYRRSDVGHPLVGFGFLVPRSAGLRTLGTVWNSSLFPGRAPDGHVLFTSFVGGATDPGAAALSPEELTSLVDNELAPLMKIRQDATAGRGKPHPYQFRGSFSHVTIYSRALPQYNLGHADRLAAIEGHRTKFPNLWLAGNYLRGPSVGACLEQSLSVANEILSRMKR
jgi:protoporphyrinogen/coproporphyrinogen III oxidase